MAKGSIAELSKVLRQKKARWTAAENHISKMSPAQRKKMLGADLKSVSKVPHEFVVTSQDISLPSSLDWRDNNGNHVTSVKDQGGCATSASFATVAVIESMVSIERGLIFDLSEADLHFCSSHGASCDGWNPYDAFSQVQTRGVVDEADFPYESAFPGPVCKISADRESRVVRFVNSLAIYSNDQAKYNLISVGPMVCVFDVYEDFYAYESGVYEHVYGGFEGITYVQIVGYSDIDNCWICKNSWGERWGDYGYFKIAYGACNIDNYTSNYIKWGLSEVVIPGPQWGRRYLWTAMQNSATDGSITSVSWNPSSMEVYRISDDGFIGDITGDDIGWTPFEQVLAPAGSASTNGCITAVSRIPSSIEIFWIGADGSVNDAYWYENAGWSTFVLAPAGSASTNGSITAVSRIPGSMEVFWIGPDGSVHDASWYENVGWNGFVLAPAGSASTNGCITAVSRIPGSMEVFWIGPDGSVHDASWYDNVGWNGFVLAPAGSASTNGSITVVSRIPDSMEVFWIGPDGSVHDAFWYDNVGWNGFVLAPAGSASTNGSITVVSRIPDSMEVFWIGPDGSIQDAFWYNGEVGWTSFELAPAGNASLNGSITSMSRIPDSMEVFWIGHDGSMQNAYWFGH